MDRPGLRRGAPQRREPSCRLAFRQLDGWLTHRVWGWVAFLGMMTLMFLCIFTVAQYPMDWLGRRLHRPRRIG